MTAYALQRRAVDCGITVSSLHPGTVGYSINQQLTMYLSVVNNCTTGWLIFEDITFLGLIKFYFNFVDEF